MIDALTNTVSITMFNRGMAGKIFSEVKQLGAKVVMKNNTPECVLMSPDEYIALMERLENAELLALATERLSKTENSQTYSREEVLAKFKVAEETLAAIDEVEFE